MAALPPGGAQICHKGALLECQLRGPMLLRKQCLPKALNERATRAMGRWRLSACELRERSEQFICERSEPS